MVIKLIASLNFCNNTREAQSLEVTPKIMFYDKNGVYMLKHTSENIPSTASLFPAENLILLFFLLLHYITI